MKNIFKLIGAMRSMAIIALVAVIGFSFAACSDSGGGGGSTANNVNGTWIDSDGGTLTLNNGNFEVSENNKNAMKGTYTVTGGNITMVVKELYGDALNEMGWEDIYIDITFESKWYNKDQLINALIEWYKESFDTDDEDALEFFNTYYDFNVLFPTVTGTVNGNNMTLNINGEIETYTKDAGSTDPDPDPGPVTGYSWTKVTDTAFGTYGINAISYANNKFVAVGRYDHMAYSSDGVTWTAVADKIFDDYHINVITYGNGKFVAGGEWGKMAYSSDGITWTSIDTGTSFDYVQGGLTRKRQIKTIAYGGGKFVAGSEEGKIATSADGITWIAVTTDAFNYDITFSTGEISHRISTIYTIAYGNGKFVAGGSDGLIATSPDGTTWTAATTDVFNHVNLGGFDIKADVYTIAYGNNKFVAGSSYCDTAYSSDGITWTRVAENKLSGVIYTIAYGNSKFIAGDAGGKIAISSDGVTWTAAGSSILGTDGYDRGYDVKGIAYGNNRFVAVGNNKIAYSTWH
jgi:hypothetical protein